MATKQPATVTSTTQTSPAGWLTPAQFQTLEAVCDALIPAVAPPAGEADAHGLYARSAHDLDIAGLAAQLLSGESPETQASFRQLLDLLAKPLGGMLLYGRPKTFLSMSPAEREAALRRMSTSSIATVRQGFQGVKRLAAMLFYCAPDASGTNPNWPTLDYTPAPPPPPAAAAPKRIRTLPITADVTLTADAIVVGSGSGGGVVAAELAAAGKDVIILEKGGYYNEADFDGAELAGMQNLYLRRGLLTTQDLGMIVLAGSALGGGTIVNWSTSLRTPPDVLEEWEREHGLTGATGAEYQQGFEVAERRLGVNTGDSQPNANNDALRRDCEALGYSWRAIPRNASDCQQRCGACGYGCPYGRKQSTMLTFLQDASDRGARVVVRCNVQRVLIEAGRAVGIEGSALDEATGQRHRVVVRAPLVVVSAGSVESPALLLRSGLTNPNIGRHLRLHPVAPMLGYYDDPIRPWQGSLQTVLSDHFARIRGGHGLRFEVMPAHPGLLGFAIPWEGGQAHKREMTRIKHAAAYIILTRDTGEGRIILDKQGDPVIQYWPNATDRALLIRGMQEVARIIFAGGGTEAMPANTPRLTLTSEGNKPGAVSETRLNAFLSEIARNGVVPNRLGLGTAHQMGTCRLGSNARTSVADPYGQVHGVRGLYIGDASGFPTASGVNPMLSTMALAYRVAQHIKANS